MNKKYAFGVLLVIILAGFFFYYFRMVSWHEYKGTNAVPVSFMYPPSVFNVLTDNGENMPSVQINNIDDIKSYDPDSSYKWTKIIAVGQASTSPGEYSSVEQYLTLVYPDFPAHLTRVTIAGEHGYLAHGGDAPISAPYYGGVVITFMHDKKIYSMSITNFSPQETERIWKSLRFVQ